MRGRSSINDLNKGIGGPGWIGFGDERPSVADYPPVLLAGLSGAVAARGQGGG